MNLHEARELYLEHANGCAEAQSVHTEDQCQECRRLLRAIDDALPVGNKPNIEPQLVAELATQFSAQEALFQEVGNEHYDLDHHLLARRLWEVQQDYAHALWNLAGVSTMACSESLVNFVAGPRGALPALTDTHELVRKLIDTRAKLAACELERTKLASVVDPHPAMSAWVRSGVSAIADLQAEVANLRDQLAQATTRAEDAEQRAEAAEDRRE